MLMTTHTTSPDPAVDRAREALAVAQKAPSGAYRWAAGVYNYETSLRAIRDAQVASGQATLTVAEELAATRAEIGQVAEAVRELTRTIAEAKSQCQAPRRPWWRRGGDRR
jgi:hypothetical protein